MQQDYKKLPDSELEVMLAIWHCDAPTHIGEIQQRLNPGKSRPYQAVQILLSRLAEKGFVKCEKLGRLNYYTPLVEEDKYRAQETVSFIDKLYGSSPARLVAALVQDSGLKESDIAEIRRILERAGE